MSKNYKWAVLSPDEVWEQTATNKQKNKKKYNKSKLKADSYGGIKKSTSREER